MAWIKEPWEEDPISECFFIYKLVCLFNYNCLICIFFIFITKAGLKNGCSILLHWKRDICNHFWYCCKVTDNYEDFFVSSYSLISSKVTVSQKLCVGLRHYVIHVFANSIFHYKIYYFIFYHSTFM